MISRHQIEHPIYVYTGTATNHPSITMKYTSLGGKVVNRIRNKIRRIERIKGKRIRKIKMKKE